MNKGWVLLSPKLAAAGIRSFYGRQEDSLREIKAVEYISVISVTTVALGLYSYYVRELLASLALFSVAFSILGLAVLGVFLVWSASMQFAIWTRPASRNMIAFSRRFITGYVRS